MTDRFEESPAIVVCEDDDATLNLLCDHLGADGFRALLATRAGDALRLCRHARPDLMLLDLALPDASGLEVLREIRGSDGAGSSYDPQVPIIVLSRRGATTDRVRGLDLGADDYVQKPFSYEELRARIRAVLRRRRGHREGTVRVGEVLIDPSRQKVTIGDREVRLARMEFTLLRVLASDPTRVFSKAELVRDVWGASAPASRSRALESHASRLRIKLDPEYGRYVVNCWGVGYRLLGD